MSSLSILQRWDHTVEMQGVASYRHGAATPKPCLHLITTPAGHCLSGFEMSDHVWHRGLWFTIKFVNGENFWEENDAHGVQRSAAQPRVELLAANAARISHAIDWSSDASGVVLREERSMRFHVHADGTRTVDWTSTLHPRKRLTLDRTPYTTWGGYGGLSFRGSRELHDVSFLLPSGDTAPALAGAAHDWTVMQASVDGGRAQRVSFGIVDHPSNPRSPSPWYNKSGNGFSYMNAAFLFHEPMTLDEGQPLRMAYRVLYRDGTWTRDEFAAFANAFRGAEVSS